MMKLLIINKNNNQRKIKIKIIFTTKLTNKFFLIIKKMI